MTAAMLGDVDIAADEMGDIVIQQGQILQLME